MKLSHFESNLFVQHKNLEATHFSAQNRDLFQLKMTEQQ